jgi:hypothetical protein
MSRPEFTDMLEAARVSGFIEEGEVGRWRVKHFTVTERRFFVEHLLGAMADRERGDGRDFNAQRTIPPGDYVCLLRKATPMELRDIEEERIADSFSPDEGYVPIMSDTPTEIREHGAALANADGRVLIVGLGLGVLVSALLANPDVEKITVVEIDRDVIALTGRYYADHPKVEIVNADILDYARQLKDEHGTRPDEVIFDYAWFDIWSHIADRNIDRDDLAEHGISYTTVFDSYYWFVEEMDAWGYNEALEMRDSKDFMRERTDAWAARFIEAAPEERLDMLEEFHMRRQLATVVDPDKPIPPEIRAFINEQMHVRENCRLQLEKDPGGVRLAADMQRILSTEESPDDPLDRPNEVPEANVAR